MKIKKILVIVLIIVVAIGATIAIIHFSNADEAVPPTTDEQTTEIPTEKPSEEITEKPIEITGDVLSDDEIKKLFVEANGMYGNWLRDPVNIEADWENIIPLGDSGYYYSEVTSCKFSNVEEIGEELKKYFSEEVYKEELDFIYKMKDGKLYANYGLCEGGDVWCDAHKLVIKSKTPTECVFAVVPVYEDDGKYVFQQGNYNKIRLIDGEWKFVESFDFSYTINWTANIKWIE